MAQLIINFMAPFFALAVALLLSWRAPDLEADQLALLAQLPYLFCILSGVIALFVNHARELALSVLMLLCYWVIQSYLQVRLDTDPAGQIYQLLSLMAPLLLIALLFVPDYGWRSPVGMVSILVAPLITLLLAGVFYIWPLWFKSATLSLVAEPFYSLKLSFTAGGLFVVSFLAGSALLFLQNKKIESSLLGCTLLLFVTLGWFQLRAISAICFTSLGLLLIINQIHSLLNLVYRDELTQIENRRALLQTAKSLGQNFSLAMIDIDHFKKINDTHGHDLGDQVLKVIASKLQQVGGGGKAFRYGGEEFCILFKGKPAAEVAPKLEELRKVIAEYDMQLRDKHTRPKRQQAGVSRRGATRRKGNLRITVSMGLADGFSEEQNFNQAMKAADAAMYKAKRSGRNRLQLA